MTKDTILKKKIDRLGPTKMLDAVISMSLNYQNYMYPESYWPFFSIVVVKRKKSSHNETPHLKKKIDSNPNPSVTATPYKIARKSHIKNS